MELTTGQRRGQEIIDINRLIKELDQPCLYKIFVDTIDEKNQVFIDGEILIIHIARSEYDAAADRHQLVKHRVKQVLRQFPQA
ncbi:MAG: hypothetical protein R2824_33380 [Saprospiraceae bacterium]